MTKMTNATHGAGAAALAAFRRRSVLWLAELSMGSKAAKRGPLLSEGSVEALEPAFLGVQLLLEGMRGLLAVRAAKEAFDSPSSKIKFDLHVGREHSISMFRNGVCRLRGFYADADATLLRAAFLCERTMAKDVLSDDDALAWLGMERRAVGLLHAFHLGRLSDLDWLVVPVVDADSVARLDGHRLDRRAVKLSARLRVAMAGDDVVRESEIRSRLEKTQGVGPFLWPAPKPAPASL